MTNEGSNLMAYVLLYFSSIAVWVILHIIYDFLRKSQRLRIPYLRAFQHSLQIVLLITTGLYEFLIRRSVAAYYHDHDVDMLWQSYVLLYGLPYGTLLYIGIVCVAVDCMHTYYSKCPSDVDTAKICAFWYGLLCSIFVPFFAYHPYSTLFFFRA